ncbi:hypothetical protein D3C81_1485810 [compost metagenome]
MVVLEHLAIGIDVTGFGRPEGQGADGVGEARALDGFAFGLEFGRGVVIGSEKNLKRCAIFDLAVELPGCPEGADQLVPGVGFEVLGNGLDGRGEIGRDGDLDFIGPGVAQGQGGEQGKA